MKSPLLKLTASFLIFFVLFSCNDSEQIAPSPVKGSLLAIKRGDPVPKGYELFKLSEPRDLVWEEIAPISSPMCQGDSAVTIDGKIYFAGGANKAGPSKLLESYDPTTNKWTTLDSMIEARSVSTGTVLNNKFYMLGGHNNTKGRLIQNEVYDPLTNNWSKIADLPFDTRSASSIAVNGKIYFIGGVTGGVQTNNTLEYDPNNDTWTSKAGMPTNRDALRLVFFENRIWALGGWYAGGPSNHVESYDPVSNTWRGEKRLKTAPVYPSAWVSNGRIFVGGGGDHNVPAGPSYYDTVQAYDPETKDWEIIGNLPLKIERADTVVLNEKVYIIGGVNSEGFSDKVFTADISPPLDLYYYK